MQKQLWLLAGGNGAGKSTFYKRFLQSRGLVFVNADNIARDIEPGQPEQASYIASQIAESFRYRLVHEGQSFCFETVFSHSSKIDFIADAKVHGYQIILVYIHLESAELNKARVAQRVLQGGHNVPAEKIESRIPRTLHNVKKALPLANEAHILDNSSYSNPYQRIATIKHNQCIRHCDSYPHWAEQLLADYLNA